MRIGRAGTAALLLLALCPAAARAEIYEYADRAGKVLYYKYTDRSGKVVFTDDLGTIPPQERSGQRVVRITAPGTKPPAAAGPRAPAAPAPAPPPPAFRVEVPEAGQPGDGLPLGYILGALLLAAAALGGKLVLGRRGGAPGRGGGAGEGDHEPGLGGEAPQAEAPAFEPPPPPLRPPEPPPRRADPRAEAEELERAGRGLEAAERYEAAYRDGGAARGLEGAELARRAGRLFVEAGMEERAVALLAKAGLPAESAPLRESLGDFPGAAEDFLRAGEAERAAACFHRAGRPARAHGVLSDHLYAQGRTAEAAAEAERGGDQLRAAELYQEAGDFAAAGRLHLAAGFHAEAAEDFLLAGDKAGAADALERAGRHLEAARAAREAGAAPERVAALYEAGGDGYMAGRFHSRAGELDRALACLARVAPDAPEARSAELLAGMIQLKRGATADATARFEALVAGRPVTRESLDPWYFLALCRQAAGRRDEARAILERIVAVEPAFRDAKQRLEWPTSG